VLLTTENSDDFEIRVPDGIRSLKVTPVNSSCVITSTTDCQTPSDQLPGHEVEQGIDGYGRKYFEKKRF